MKILSIILLSDKKPTHVVYDLSHYSFLQRSSIKEFLTFITQTIVDHAKSGTTVVEHEEHLVVCLKTNTALSAVAITDKDYPPRITNAMLREALSIPTALDKILEKYQNPQDIFMRINCQIDETKDLLIITIDKVLQRGETLEALIEKSDKLSASSKVFYKKAKQTNSCCSII